MKKIPALLITALLTTALATAAFAQDSAWKISGEAKSGIFWQQVQTEGETERKPAEVRLHNKDDAGGEEGRFRLNLDYENGKNFGMRARVQWDTWKDPSPAWSYAFGYGNFFENQLTVSVGKLGGSPWGTGGPEKWKELEVGRYGGMRVEWKPAFVPETAGRFNVGFVLNWLDDPDESSLNDDATLLDLLSESVLGFSWIHDDFGLVRFAYRLDSGRDRAVRGTEEYGKEGDKLIYRIEETMLKDFLPGLQMWALGVYTGVGADHPMFQSFENWFFAQYAPDLFTAQIRIGYDYIESRSVLHVKPTFYLNLFDRLLSVGTSFWYGQDFGEGKMHEGSPFVFMEIEPKIQLNFSSSYIAFVYNFRREYIHWTPQMGTADPIKQTQWINLRFCIYY